MYIFLNKSCAKIEYFLITVTRFTLHYTLHRGKISGQLRITQGVFF